MLHFVSSGEQNTPSAVQLVPLTTLWLPLIHVHCTVSPAWMMTCAGWNSRTPLGPTATWKTLPASDAPASPASDASATVESSASAEESRVASASPPSPSDASANH